MNRKKLAASGLMLTILLSLVGYVYAAWTDKVFIDGTVEMGSLTLVFTTQEPPIFGDFEHLNDPYKDVGDIYAYYTGVKEDTHTLKSGYDTLVVEITNAYPCYVAYTIFVVENIGTIPLIIYGWDIAVEDSDGIDLVYNPVVGAWVYPDAMEVPILNIGVVDLIGKQLEPEDDPATFPEEENKAKAELDIHPKQDAKECHTYYISMTIKCVQWNKAFEFM